MRGKHEYVRLVGVAVLRCEFVEQLHGDRGQRRGGEHLDGPVVAVPDDDVLDAGVGAHVVSLSAAQGSQNNSATPTPSVVASRSMPWVA